MSDKIKIFLEIDTNNEKFINKSFELLRDYICQEIDTEKLKSAINQIYPLLEYVIDNKTLDLGFIENEEFRNFMGKVRIISSYPGAKDIITLIEGDQKNLSALKNELDNYISPNTQSALHFANTYLDFYSTLKKSLKNGEESWKDIKESWNQHCEFFDTDRISHSHLQSVVGNNHNLPQDFYSNYLKLVKTCQEKIAETLWNNFLLHPENSEKFAKFSPDFFQFVNWLERPEVTTRNFVGLLEQKHFDNLAYASKVQGFDYFLDKLFLLTPELCPDFDPFAGNPANNYNYINLEAIKNLNAKNINADVLFKNNELNLANHLRDYLYHHIEKLEQSGKVHSQEEFLELDKLLTIYEKQKLESVLLPKNTKSKKVKI